MQAEVQRRFCVGVDLHKTQFTVSGLTEEGEFILEEVYQTNKEGYGHFIEQLHEAEESGQRIELAVETTGNARYFKNKMEKEGFLVKVVNTNRFKVITMSTKKTDLNDAATLAYYLQKEMLPESHLCDQTSEEMRRMLKTRSILVQSTVKIKNQIHGMMLGYGIETKAAQLQSKKRRQQLIYDLKDHDFSEYTASSLEVMLSILENLAEEIKRVEEEIGKMVQKNEDVRLLQTIPGVGPINSATIAAYTADMSRFDGDYKRFASYIGIVPVVHHSNEHKYNGRITKHGPQELRTAMVQVALGMIRLPHRTREWKLLKKYQQQKTEKGSGKAIIALARKLSRIIFVMLTTRKEFDAERMI